MLNLIKMLVILALLSVPILAITTLPRLFDLAGSGPSGSGQGNGSTPSPTFRLVDTTPTVRSRFAPLQETPPPTLSVPVPAPAARPAVPAATPSPSATGERVLIGNTGGIGAVLRADPVTGRPVAALREQQVLEVLDRRTVPGSGDWLHVRTADGVDGWVTAVVTQPFLAPATH